MLENYYTCEVSVKDDNLIIQTKKYKTVGAFYQVPLSNIASVSTDEIPFEWLGAKWSKKAWSSSSDVAKNLTIAESRNAGLIRALYTETTLFNPKTKNPAFLLYKHRDKCVTLTLKKPMTMVIQNINFGQTPSNILTGIQEVGNVSVLEVSFEVDDKESTAKSILEVLKGNINALPQASLVKMSKKEFRNLEIKRLALIVGVPVILVMIIVMFFLTPIHIRGNLHVSGQLNTNFSSSYLVLTPICVKSRYCDQPVMLPVSADGSFSSDSVHAAEYKVTLSPCNYSTCSQTFPFYITPYVPGQTEILNITIGQPFVG